MCYHCTICTCVCVLSEQNTRLRLHLDRSIRKMSSHDVKPYMFMCILDTMMSTLFAVLSYVQQHQHQEGEHSRAENLQWWMLWYMISAAYCLIFPLGWWMCIPNTPYRTIMKINLLYSWLTVRCIICIIFSVWAQNSQSEIWHTTAFVLYGILLCVDVLRYHEIRLFALEYNVSELITLGISDGTQIMSPPPSVLPASSPSQDSAVSDHARLHVDPPLYVEVPPFTCYICLDDMSSCTAVEGGGGDHSTVIMTRPCGHHVHRSCLSHFIGCNQNTAVHNLCPLCRIPIRHTTEVVLAA